MCQERIFSYLTVLLNPQIARIRARALPKNSFKDQVIYYYYELNHFFLQKSLQRKGKNVSLKVVKEMAVKESLN